jgi:flagellar biosynthesis protein FliP
MHARVIGGGETEERRQKLEERQVEQSRKFDSLDSLLRQFISSQMKDKNTQNPVQPSEMSTESAEIGNAKKKKKDLKRHRT